MKYPEKIKEMYDDVMNVERYAIQEFLKMQYDIRCGSQADSWHFDKPVEMIAKQGSSVLVHDVKLDTNKVVVFNVEAFCEKNVTWECFDFAYGELRNIIEAFPSIDELLKNRALSDLYELAVKTNVRKLLEKSPYIYVEEEGSVTTQFVPSDVTFKELSDKYGSDYITKLRDHVHVEYLHSTKEYNEVMFLLTKEPRSYKEASEYGDVTFNLSDIKFDVTSVGVDDSGHLVIFGGDIKSNVCDNMAITEKDIKVEYLEVILKWLNETKWNDIMDTYNSHNKELVRKINAAWKSDKYHDMFKDILFAIGSRDSVELLEKHNLEICSLDDAMNYAHELMENVCDDQDLECILNFIRYEE